MSLSMGFGRLVASTVAVAALLSSAAAIAQVPPPPLPAEVNACLCLQRLYSGLAADMNAKNQAYQAANREVEGLTAELDRERASTNVNNPDAVARVKALLERRDAATKTLPVAQSAAADAVSRYNAAVSEYNARCIRPGIPVLVPGTEASLVCPPGQ
jgi:hypothetical protein